MLCISYGGSKTWRALFYVQGKPHSKSLGSYPTVSVAEARQKAHAFDPEAAVASNAAGTFKTVAEDWIKKYVDEKHLRTRHEIVRCLNVYVYPEWERRPIFDIRRVDVNKLLDQVVKNHHGKVHGKVQADAVLNICRSLMGWYATRDDRYNSPIVKGMNRDQRPTNERARKRILGDDEIRLLWQACEELGTYGAGSTAAVDRAAVAQGVDHAVGRYQRWRLDHQDRRT